MTGGRQGFKNAQMFPEDFDGVIAGAPAWWTVSSTTAVFGLTYADLKKSPINKFGSSG